MKSMFDKLQPAPADSIFGLNEQFLRDPNPDKINLTVGVYQDEHGKTPIMRSVHSAEQRLLTAESTKDYLSMDGFADYNRAVADLVLPSKSQMSARGCATLQTLGGTGALRLTADLLAHSLGHTNIWHSEPTWPNHLGIFRAAGLDPLPYRYLDAHGRGLDFGNMMTDLSRIPPGSAFLVHAVCHNPTGFDLTRPQWEELAELVATRGLITVFDFAYQGLGESIERDAWPIDLFSRQDTALFICNSFSKNMGLYGERVGACTVVVDESKTASVLLSHLKLHARCSYSNPVRHGAQLAAMVLGQADLRQEWTAELNAMRQRLTQLRQLLFQTLRAVAPTLDFDFVQQQRGMFSYSGLTSQQIQVLREKYSIYALSNGRINVAGVRPKNVERLCHAIADVCGASAPSASLSG